MITAHITPPGGFGTLLRYGDKLTIVRGCHEIGLLLCAGHLLHDCPRGITIRNDEAARPGAVFHSNAFSCPTASSTTTDEGLTNSLWPFAGLSRRLMRAFR